MAGAGSNYLSLLLGWEKLFGRTVCGGGGGGRKKVLSRRKKVLSRREQVGRQ